MKFRMNYGNGVVCLPEAVLALLDRADGNAVKVLLHIASGANDSAAHIAQLLSLDVATVKEAIAFWRGAGLIEQEGTEQKKAPTPNKRQAEAIPSVRVEDSASAVAVKTPTPTTLPRYTTEELTALLERRAELSELIDECARVFGKVFNTHETSILLGIVDYLGLDGEYLLLLLAHCAKIGKKSVRYVEKFAFSLYDEGVNDLPALQEALKKREQLADAEGKIRIMFGISSRALTTKERKMIDAWLFQMHYSNDVIEHAYEITVDAIGKPSIPYTNSILERWAAANLKTLSEIEEAEKDRAGGKASLTPGNSFDTDDFFGAALNRSFGGDFAPNATKKSTKATPNQGK